MIKRACLGALIGLTLASATAFAAQPSYADMLPKYNYTLIDSHQVEGRQGIACDGKYYYVSGSKTLAKYDKKWNLIKIDRDPFVSYEVKANHFGDIDVYNGEIFCGAENFMDGVGKDIQITIHDADTLKFKRSFPFAADSGQVECSGITVNTDDKTVWMCSWVGEESGRYLYEYDLDTGYFLRKVNLQAPPYWVQGMFYWDGSFFMTADDGRADIDGDHDKGEPDCLWRADIKKMDTKVRTVRERAFTDVTFQGEIEGLAVDPATNEFLLLYNRGSRIILGMVRGFYPGYDKEITEVFRYKMEKIDWSKQK